MEDTGFEVAAASQAAWNEVMKAAERSGKHGAQGGWKGGVEIAGVEKSLSRVDPRGVRTSVVLAEAAEAEDVIRMRPAFKVKAKPKHGYQSDVWETIDEVEWCKLKPIQPVLKAPAFSA